MFLYCISPYRKLESNFIKVGSCEDITSLKTRYVTYYGYSCRYYYVKIINRNDENKIIKNNENEDIYILKRNHIFEFIIYIYENTNDNKNKMIIKYYKKEDMEDIWKKYLTFCVNIKQYYNTKTILKKYIQSVVYCDNPTIYKNYKIDFKINEINITNLKYINNKYIRCKNKLKILLLYEYIKLKRKSYINISNYINYMINIPLHENIVQNIIRNIKKNKEINNCEKPTICINENNKKINNKLRKKKYIMEYKVLCSIINIKIIENSNIFKCFKCINCNNNCIRYNKIKNSICKLIDYKNNKIYNKEEIASIVSDLLKIINILKKISNIDNIIKYVSHLLYCINQNNYQNACFISLKSKFLKEINKSM